LVVLIVLFALFLVLIYPLMCINDAYWSYGRIPPVFPYTVKNEQHILLLLATIIVRKDLRDILEKNLYLNSHFKQFQGYVYYESRKDFNLMMRNPVKMDEIGKWLNKHITTQSKKKNIVQLMINISMIDGELTGNEYNTLKYFNNLLQLPSSDFDEMVYIHLQRQEERRKSEQKLTSYRSETQKIRSLKILSLSENADDATIKKAYRNLVKEWHPDKFAKDSPIQQQLAQERFIEIQKAYEYLSNQ